MTWIGLFVVLFQRPLGMRLLITKTLDAILSNTHHPILPSMSVHLAIRQFLEVCVSKNEIQEKRTRSAFIGLLHTICQKIKEENSLCGIFFE